jgi:hypothetical protein
MPTKHFFTRVALLLILNFGIFVHTQASELKLTSISTPDFGKTTYIKHPSLNNIQQAASTVQALLKEPLCQINFPLHKSSLKCPCILRNMTPCQNKQCAEQISNLAKVCGVNETQAYACLQSSACRSLKLYQKKITQCKNQSCITSYQNKINTSPLAKNLYAACDNKNTCNKKSNAHTPPQCQSLQRCQKSFSHLNRLKHESPHYINSCSLKINFKLSAKRNKNPSSAIYRFLKKHCPEHKEINFYTYQCIFHSTTESPQTCFSKMKKQYSYFDISFSHPELSAKNKSISLPSFLSQQNLMPVTTWTGQLTQEP